MKAWVSICRRLVVVLAMFLGLVPGLEGNGVYEQDPPPTQEYIDALSAYLQTDPQNAVAYSKRGEAYAQLGQEQKMRADFATAFKLKPASPLIRVWFGTSLFLLGHTEEAMAMWQEAKEASRNLELGDDVPAWVPAAQALGYWAEGKRDLAFKSYAEADRRFPQNFSDKILLLRATRTMPAKEQAMFVQLYEAWRHQGK